MFCSFWHSRYLICKQQNGYSNISSKSTGSSKKWTVFDNYAEEFNSGRFEYNKPYRIVTESSGNTYREIDIISHNKLEHVSVKNLTPDDDLKVLIGAYLVFDKEQEKIRVFNEEKLKEYQK